VIIPGLCSVTLRACSIEQIATVVRDNALGAIEWGADVHVPPGDLEAAARARAASDGLVVTYGSYLLAGGAPVSDGEIVVVLDTAETLGARTVRVWAPFGVTGRDPRRVDVVSALQRATQLAATRDLLLALEFHGGTLTETVASTLALLDDVGAANLLTYWQPPYWVADRSIADDVADVQALAGHLANLHVYEWAPTPSIERRPLTDGAVRWGAVFDAVDSTPLPTAFGGPRVALLEFVADDDSTKVRADAVTLRNLLDRER
jgi:3-dehydroshikimate dehydratase